MSASAEVVRLRIDTDHGAPDVPPPQCPECGRFLATAFVEQIKAEAAPCPGCGTELSLADDTADEAVEPEESPPVPPPAATLPAEGPAGAGDAVDDDAGEDAADEPQDADEPEPEPEPEPEDADEADETEAPDLTDLGDDTSEAAATEVPGELDLEVDDDPRAGSVLDEVEPEPDASVRPPDLRPERDPLEGWDEQGTVPATAAAAAPDPTALAAGAGVGLLVGLLLGGRDHRGLGAVLGAALGAVLSRLRG